MASSPQDPQLALATNHDNNKSTMENTLKMNEQDLSQKRNQEKPTPKKPDAIAIYTSAQPAIVDNRRGSNFGLNHNTVHKSVDKQHHHSHRYGNNTNLRMLSPDNGGMSKASLIIDSGEESPSSQLPSTLRVN